jgi:hypothetical protein
MINWFLRLIIWKESCKEATLEYSGKMVLGNINRSGGIVRSVSLFLSLSHHGNAILRYIFHDGIFKIWRFFMKWVG